jgi:hypothetical protein
LGPCMGMKVHCISCPFKIISGFDPSSTFWPINNKNNQ